MLAQGAAAGQARGDQGAALGGREGEVAVFSSPRPGVTGALVPSKQPLLEEAARPQKAERDHLVGAEGLGRSRRTGPLRLDGWHRGATGGGDDNSRVAGCAGLGSPLSYPDDYRAAFDNRITVCFAAIIRFEILGSS